MIIKSPKRFNQKGMASIVVVTVLVVMMTLISIGFARLMSRSLSSATTNQLNSAANYAVRSGINDTYAYILASLQTNPSNTVSVTSCNQIIDNTVGHTDSTKINPDFASNGVEKYTCILASTNLDNLIESKIPPSESKIVKMVTAPTNIDSMLLSWQSADPSTHNSFPASGTSLLDETTWNNQNYAPLLRVTLYPIGNGASSTSVANSQSNSRTFFLYPTSSTVTASSCTSVTNKDTTCPYSKADGSLIPVYCDNISNKGIDFYSSTSYNCNLVINGIQAATSASYFYARFTPIYDQASLQIKADDASNNPVKFPNDQAMIDVTAKAATATKRLRARVELGNPTGGDDNFPEDSLRSAEAICKRMQVLPTGSIKVDDLTCAKQTTLNNPVPQVSLKVNGSPSLVTINVGQSVKMTWTSSWVSSCPTSSPGSWASGNSSVNNTTGLDVTPPAVGTYTYTITCQDTFDSGTTPSNSVTVKVKRGPPAINTFYSSPSGVIDGTNNTTLYWTSTNADSCYISDASGGPIAQLPALVGPSGSFPLNGLSDEGFTVEMVCEQGNPDDNPFSTNTYYANVLINSHAPPMTGSFTGTDTGLGANGSAVPSGSSVTLHWSSSTATGCYLQNSGGGLGYFGATDSYNTGPLYNSGYNGGGYLLYCFTDPAKDMKLVDTRFINVSPS